MTCALASKLDERRKKGQLSTRWMSTVPGDRGPKRCGYGARFLAVSSCFGREFAFPPRDHHARDAIAENGHRRAPHVHKLINGKEQEKRLHGQVKRSCRSENNEERCACHAGGPFAADQQRQNHHHLLANAEV